MSTPFWGESDAAIDWCEGNYVVTEYIAEFWNTISSIIIMAIGLFGLYLTIRHKLDLRFQFTYVTLASVGLGSTCFHASLRFIGQAMDVRTLYLASLTV